MYKLFYNRNSRATMAYEIYIFNILYKPIIFSICVTLKKKLHFPFKKYITVQNCCSVTQIIYQQSLSRKLINFIDEITIIIICIVFLACQAKHTYSCMFASIYILAFMLVYTVQQNRDLFFRYTNIANFDPPF